MIPPVPLLTAYLIRMFRSRAPWLHKLGMGLGLAASLMLMLVLERNNTFNPALYTVLLVWAFPTRVWAAMSRWLKRKR